MTITRCFPFAEVIQVSIICLALQLSSCDSDSSAVAENQEKVGIWLPVTQSQPSDRKYHKIGILCSQDSIQIRYPGPDGVLCEDDFPCWKDNASFDSDDEFKDTLLLPRGEFIYLYFSSRDLIHRPFIPALRVVQVAAPAMKSEYLLHLDDDTGESNDSSGMVLLCANDLRIPSRPVKLISVEEYYRLFIKN